MVGARLVGGTGRRRHGGRTLVLAVTAFDFGGPDDPFPTAEDLAGVLAEAAFVTLTVVAIIGPALGIHHLQQRTGATAVLQAGLARLHPDPRVAALLIAWFFALFLEGAAGLRHAGRAGRPVPRGCGLPAGRGGDRCADRPRRRGVVRRRRHAGHGPGGDRRTSPAASWPRPPRRTTSPSAGSSSRGASSVVVGRALPVAVRRGGGGAGGGAFFVPYGLIARFVGPSCPRWAARRPGRCGVRRRRTRGRGRPRRTPPTRVDDARRTARRRRAICSARRELRTSRSWSSSS
jgi:lactate permease